MDEINFENKSILKRNVLLKGFYPEFKTLNELDGPRYKPFRFGFPIKYNWHTFLVTIYVEDGRYTNPAQVFIDQAPPQVKGIIERRFFGGFTAQYMSATSFLCLRHEGKLYLCEWEDFSRLFYYIPLFFDGGADQLRVAYIIAICSIKHDFEIEDKTLRSRICPNPCHPNANRCRNVRNVYTDLCELVDTTILLYDNNYKCQCKDQFEWDPLKLDCVPKNLCYLNKYCGGFLRSLYCYMRPSLAEEIQNGKKDYIVECNCKMKYMGEKCELERNACIENFYTELPSGNSACGEHGKCIHTLGTNIYKCECEITWEDDPQTPYPDCSFPSDPCTTMKCFNGYCKMSDDRTFAECVCYSGYKGKYCDERYGGWLQWQPWSQCSPQCGASRKRTRNRTCSDWKSMASCYQPGFLADGEGQKCVPRVCLNEGQWTNWTFWTKCEGQCMKRFSSRKRDCKYTRDFGLESVKVSCTGPAVETRDCPITSNCDQLFYTIFLFSFVTITVFLGMWVFLKKAIKKLEQFLISLNERINVLIRTAEDDEDDDENVLRVNLEI